jgi:hypothetical protein
MVGDEAMLVEAFSTTHDNEYGRYLNGATTSTSNRRRSAPPTSLLLSSLGRTRKTSLNWRLGPRRCVGSVQSSGDEAGS